MKPQTFFALSLLGNCVLGAMTFHLVKAKSPPSSHARAAIPSGAKTNSLLKAAAEKNFVTNVVAEEFTWRQIEAEDYKIYIANLRAVGCPEETIRDIILADVNKLYAPKMGALMRHNEGQYWKSHRDWNTSEGRERLKKYRELQKEKSALLVELLGVDPEKEHHRELGFLDYQERNYNFLSDDKKELVRITQEKFEEQRQELYRNGIYDAEDQKALKKIYADQLAEMAQFLTPQELAEYDIRASQTSHQLRYDLDIFEPSEIEFRQIYALKQMREEDLAYNYDPDDKVAEQRRKKAGEEVDSQIKTTLGDARFEEYKRSQDWSYKELVRLTDRAGLPKETAASVYDMRKIAEDQAKQIRGDKTLSNEQRNLALQAIQDETQKAITQALGEKSFNRYKSHGGYWISNLAPRLPTKRP